MILYILYVCLLVWMLHLTSPHLPAHSHACTTRLHHPPAERSTCSSMFLHLPQSKRGLYKPSLHHPPPSWSLPSPSASSSMWLTFTFSSIHQASNPEPPNPAFTLATACVNVGFVGVACTVLKNTQ